MKFSIDDIMEKKFGYRFDDIETYVANLTSTILINIKGEKADYQINKTMHYLTIIEGAFQLADVMTKACNGDYDEIFKELNNVFKDAICDSLNKMVHSHFPDFRKDGKL